MIGQDIYQNEDGMIKFNKKLEFSNSISLHQL